MIDTDEPEVSDTYTEEQLLRMLTRLDATIRDLERVLAGQRALRGRVAARLKEKSGNPVPPPPSDAGANVVPLRKRPTS